MFGSEDFDTRPCANGILVELVRDKSDFRVFYQVPFEIYKENPYWVAPFWHEINGFFRKKNLFWSHAEGQLFIAYRQGKAIGRIAAILDHAYCKRTGQTIGFFGFFECIQDFGCARALLQTAQDWLVSKGAAMMQGPIDGRIDVGSGFLYNGFEGRPSLLSSYSPPYYVTYAERFGLIKSRDLFLYRVDLTKPLPQLLEEKARQCVASGIEVRPFDRLRSARELSWWVDLFLETFSDHWGFVPVSPKEVRTRFGIQQLRWFVDSSLFLVALWKGSPVAYLWSTPDYNQLFQGFKGRLGPFEMLWFLIRQRTINSGKLHLIGIKKEFRNRNIGSLLNYRALVEMQHRGYETAEIGWIDEQNTTAHKTIALTGATLYKKHRVFEKGLRETPTRDKRGDA